MEKWQGRWYRSHSYSSWTYFSQRKSCSNLGTVDSLWLKMLKGISHKPVQNLLCHSNPSYCLESRWGTIWNLRFSHWKLEISKHFPKKHEHKFIQLKPPFTFTSIWWLSKPASVGRSSVYPRGHTGDIWPPQKVMVSNGEMIQFPREKIVT